MKTINTYPLRLPRSIKAEVERRAKADGTSVNQFVATAVAEKLATMSTAEFFSERRQRADFAAFDQLMRRSGGEPPGTEDTIEDRSSTFIAMKNYIEIDMRRAKEFYQPVMYKALLEHDGTASVTDIATAFYMYDPELGDMEYYVGLLTKRNQGTPGCVLEKYRQVEWLNPGYRLRYNVGELGDEERQELIRLLDEEIAKQKRSYRGNLARDKRRG
jgi:hypothetical protein